ncbi:ABC transporter permease [Alkalicoccobacillus murimartini]|uniref:ABC-2 type transport system permease protein n=1 Tax=Alkalicoccobacillus murimartini TaxID=171685 RepID=A0ABT9YL76_9BACI|nr:ABC transporter permease [Alkalicoccobacillus murimartini]MDQ0208624.1 ABC-2 type transport system permease protein [Alkalicoccobacillus murimartini]
MKDLFIERFHNSMQQNSKILVKVLGHSGVFALVPFIMLLVYVVIMVLQDGNLHSFYQSFILTGLFLFLTLNRGIVSYISEFDEIYLAPKVKGMEGYLIYCLLYNLTIQSIKVALFTLFLLYALSLNMGELATLFIFIQLIGILHILFLVMIISTSTKRTELFFGLHMACVGVCFLLLLEAPVIFGVAIIIGIILIGILYSRNRIFPIHSWKRLMKSEEKTRKVGQIFLSSFIDIKSNQSSFRNILPLAFFKKNENPIVYLLVRSTIRGTETSRNFVRVILLTVFLIVYFKSLFILIPLLAVLIYFNTLQFSQGIGSGKEFIPLHFPIDDDMINDAKKHIKRRGVLIQLYIFMFVMFIQIFFFH